MLFLTDPVDEMLVQWVWEFKEKKLKSVAKGIADLGDDKDLAPKVKEFSSLMDVLQSKLDASVKQVRLSGRLTSSPVCLVVADEDMSPNLEALIGKAKGESTRQKRIMEINPDHETRSEECARCMRQIRGSRCWMTLRTFCTAMRCWPKARRWTSRRSSIRLSLRVVSRAI